MPSSNPQPHTINIQEKTMRSIIVEGVTVNLFPSRAELDHYRYSTDLTRGQLYTTDPRLEIVDSFYCPRGCTGCPAQGDGRCHENLNPKLLKALSTIYRRS